MHLRGRGVQSAADGRMVAAAGYQAPHRNPVWRG